MCHKGAFLTWSQPCRESRTEEWLGWRKRVEGTRQAIGTTWGFHCLTLSWDTVPSRSPPFQAVLCPLATLLSGVRTMNTLDRNVQAFHLTARRLTGWPGNECSLSSCFDEGSEERHRSLAGTCSRESRVLGEKESGWIGKRFVLRVRYWYWQD